MNEIGELLKKLRGKRTVREVAKISGVSYASISLCERGVNTDNKPFVPSPDILHKLSKAYNYSYTELMTIAGYIPKTISQTVDLLEKENVITIGDYVLNDDQKTRLLQMIRIMFPDEENQE
jgi:transcriptional regulator with XRE-family HTH domain